MRLIFENERGRIVMHGGGGHSWNITRISGLSLPEINVNSVRYPYAAGQVVTRANIMERYITVSGDVCDEKRKYISHAINIFLLPGVLYVESFGKTKKINVRCISFEPNQSKGMYVPFTIQFCADSPYFEDLYEIKTQIIRHEKKLSSPFVLGCAFSERLLKNNVINRGDIVAEPVFEIYSKEGAVCPYGIYIRNIKNGKVIKLITNLSADECITVDVKNRKITSNKRGNILSCLAKLTSLSEFSLEAGVSAVEITAEEISGEISAVCIHTNSYISADV